LLFNADAASGPAFSLLVKSGFWHTFAAHMDKQEANTQEQIAISIAGMQTSYSNMVRGLMTSEEVILDFGVNPNITGKIVDEPVQLTNRIVMSLPSAVRLHQLLQAMLARRQQAEQQQKQAPAAADKPTE
jgi:hypothetical protein